MIASQFLKRCKLFKSKLAKINRNLKTALVYQGCTFCSAILYSSVQFNQSKAL